MYDVSTTSTLNTPEQLIYGVFPNVTSVTNLHVMTTVLCNGHYHKLLASSHAHTKFVHMQCQFLFRLPPLNIRCSKP